MNTLSEWKPILLGAAGGGMVIVLLGFTVFGWLPASTAAKVAQDEASAAVVAALSPICVSQFNAGTDAAARLTELKGLTDYNQGGFIEKGGWATMPGAEQPISGVAKGCANLLVAS